MPDRVKQAIFDILGSHYDCPGGLPPIDVADVFAGSGSMGIEALSRGAASCCFIERDPIALSALRANLDALKVGPEATIVKGDAWMQIPRIKRDSPDTSIFSERLIFLDPPYDDSDDSSPHGQVMQYRKRLAAGGIGKTMVVVHHRAKVHFVLQDADEWRILDHRTFGGNGVTFFTR